MKKSILISIVLLIVLGITSSVFAYETSDYSIDLPASFTAAGTNFFTSSNEMNFNVQIEEYDEKQSGYPYTDAHLKEYAEILENGGAKIKSKEISKVTKNNYKCLKVEGSVKNLYGNEVPCQQYVIISNNKAYIISCGAVSDELMNGSEMQQMISSFTIKNYKEPNAPANVMIWVIGGAAAGAIIGAVLYFGRKNKNNTAA